MFPTFVDFYLLCHANFLKLNFLKVLNIAVFNLTVTKGLIEIASVDFAQQRNKYQQNFDTHAHSIVKNCCRCVALYTVVVVSY